MSTTFPDRYLFVQSTPSAWLGLLLVMHADHDWEADALRPAGASARMLFFPHKASVKLSHG